jgi:hypothetical protein
MHVPLRGCHRCDAHCSRSIFGRVIAPGVLADELSALHRVLVEELGAVPSGKWSVDIAFKHKHAIKKGTGGVSWRALRALDTCALSAAPMLLLTNGCSSLRACGVGDDGHLAICSTMHECTQQ